MYRGGWGAGNVVFRDGHHARVGRRLGIDTVSVRVDDERGTTRFRDGGGRVLPRLRTRSGSQPEQDRRGEGDCGEEGLRAPIVSGGDTPPVLQPAEHDLDAVAPLVASLVVSHGLLAGLPAWDADLHPLVFQCFSEPIGIVTPVRQQPVRFREAAQQRRRTGVVADWTGRQEEPDRPAVRIGDGVQLGVHAALGAPNLAFAPPFMDGPPLPPISV